MHLVERFVIPTVIGALIHIMEKPAIDYARRLNTRIYHQALPELMNP